MWGQNFHILAIQTFLEESIVNIATDNYEEEKLLSLIESKIIESALHDSKEIELRKYLNSFQGLSESGTKDTSTTPLVAHYIDNGDSAAIKQKPYRWSCN